MNEIRSRLKTCFATVFPDLPNEKIPAASQQLVSAWDSVAAISLVGVIEDEFNMQIDLEQVAELDSFDAIANYLSEHAA